MNIKRKNRKILGRYDSEVSYRIGYQNLHIILLGRSSHFQQMKPRNTEKSNESPELHQPTSRNRPQPFEPSRVDQVL
jgi:hypothetical protein